MQNNQITYGPDLLEAIGLSIFGLLLLGALVLIICMIIGEEDQPFPSILARSSL